MGSAFVDTMDNHSVSSNALLAQHTFRVRPANVARVKQVIDWGQLRQRSLHAISP